MYGSFSKMVVRSFIGRVVLKDALVRGDALSLYRQACLKNVSSEIPISALPRHFVAPSEGDVHCRAPPRWKMRS